MSYSCLMTQNHSAQKRAMSYYTMLSVVPPRKGVFDAVPSWSSVIEQATGGCVHDRFFTAEPLVPGSTLLFIFLIVLCGSQR
jgi:hypothetical protein